VGAERQARKAQANPHGANGHDHDSHPKRQRRLTRRTTHPASQSAWAVLGTHTSPVPAPNLGAVSGSRCVLTVDCGPSGPCRADPPMLRAPSQGELEGGVGSYERGWVL